MASNTANMNLSQPTINVDSGLVWEQSMNNNASIIDAHDHSAGNGVQIGASGINLNGDLSFNDWAAINLASSVYFQQTSLSTLNAVYVKADGNLYFNDAASNVVQLTSGGVVNATSSGISSGAATASFVASVLVVNAAANTPANIQCASILLGNNSLASNYLTLSPPSAMAASYSVTLPSIPVSSKILAMNTSGVMSAAYSVDNSTIEIAANIIQVKDSGITAAKMAASSVAAASIQSGAVTQVKMGALGQQLSTSTGTFQSGSASFVDVTNATVTITTTGRPVMLLLIPENSTNTTFIGAQGTSSSDSDFRFLRDGVSEYSFSLTNSSASIVTPVGAIQTVDPVAAGTYVYKLQCRTNASGGNTIVRRAKLLAYEL